MKKRNGFVSNSSSTAFTFCFKGKNLKSLTDLILTKYSEYFKCSFEEWHCNAFDVTSAMERCAKKSDSYDKIEVVSIDKLIRDEKAAIKREEASIKEYKAKNDQWLLEIYRRSLAAATTKLERFKRIKKKGLTRCLVMGFGDNHGHVSGGDLGYAMDYDGRGIDINADDLVVFTEQNR